MMLLRLMLVVLGYILMLIIKMDLDVREKLIERQVKLSVVLTNYKDFFDTLDKGTQEKVLYGLLLLKTQDRLPAKYVKFLKEGLYELRIEWQGNIYRIFFCYDEGHIVILFNGFQKKTQKTPDREIDKALKLKKEYYERKRTKDV